jgi:hypothetical protein
MSYHNYAMKEVEMQRLRDELARVTTDWHRLGKLCEEYEHAQVGLKLDLTKATQCNTQLRTELQLANSVADSSAHGFLKAERRVVELEERWRKTHEPSELRVQLARALEEIAELKRQVRPAIPDEYNEDYSKAISQKL